MKVIVTGGRGFPDRQFVFDTLDVAKEKRGISLLIVGGARGADEWARQWAMERQVNHMIYPAKWDVFGKAAGHRRNKEMLNENPDYIVAFTGGRGTQNMRDIAEATGYEVIDTAGRERITL